MGVLGLASQRYVSRCFLISTRSLVVVEEAVFLEVVNVKVAVFSIAVVTVAVLEVVVVKVPSPLDSWRLEKGGLHRHIRSVGLPVVECFLEVGSREEDFTSTSVCLDSQWWSAVDAVTKQLKSRWHWCSTL